MCATAYSRKISYSGKIFLLKDFSSFVEERGENIFNIYCNIFSLLKYCGQGSHFSPVLTTITPSLYLHIYIYKVKTDRQTEGYRIRRAIAGVVISPCKQPRYLTYLLQLNSFNGKKLTDKDIPC
jgi:hypothetical protein